MITVIETAWKEEGNWGKWWKEAEIINTGEVFCIS